MNLAFLLPEYPHPKVSAHCGGIGTSAKNLATGLVMNAHKLTIFVYGQDKDELFYDGLIEIHKIKHLRYPFFGWFLYRKHLQNYINEVIVAQKIQLLEAPDWTGITAFMKLKCPIVIRLHGSDAYFCKLEERKQKLKNFIFEKCALKKAKAIISVSNYTLKITEQIFKIKKPATVIPNGLYLKNFLEDKIIETDKNAILYFGTIIRKKGVLELAAIFNELVIINPLAKLKLAGRDVFDSIENKSTLQLIEAKLSQKAKQNFKYLGVVSYNEMKTIIENNTVCVFPSLAESFGMVTIEAMALKKAIVNTNFQWANEIMVDGETGYLENPKNHNAFAIKINDLLKNKELRTAFGANAHNYVERHFSMEKLVIENINFYQKIINNDF